MCNLLQLLLQQGSQILGNPQSLTGNFNRSNTSGLGTIGTFTSNTLLDGNVIRILTEEVRHSTGIFGSEDIDVGFVFLIGHAVTEELFTISICDSSVTGISTTTIGLHRNSLARLGLDGKFNLIEIGPLLSTGSRQSLTAAEFFIRLDAIDVVHTDIVETDQQCQLMDGHILEHTLTVALEAFTERLSVVLIGIVADESHVTVIHRSSEVAHVGHVFAHILVVAHEHVHASFDALCFHGLELTNGGGARFLEIDGGTSCSDGFTH
mmetsp:Transcript_6073/g.8848  ORF Transcript_6073/g.8848 Transcript_6073/m.8848 type:complete len:265 (-) Transcript_6073:379-1173(-)